MTTNPTPHNDGEQDELHRYELTVSMNWVIRTCQDIIRNHSHRTFWTPTGSAEGAASTDHLIRSAREDVLSRLQAHLDGAQAILAAIEHERAKRHPEPRRDE
ncbi:hypothetical protein [Streptomyces zagrosensis]|uniref:Uncharacterized protein n=1 Tax=Streptomyces zagrosensis TaxID=1042984 RepID=A0A7W9UXD0_9ACTN|nr:hypothetical protein [Streptomyces zagrosensis]MBB5934487.1 hypothetical protein [Streptomyces zagrosensis]